MKHKHYQRPTTKVVMLQYQTHLLQTSGGKSGSAGLQDYTVVNEGDE